MPTPFFRALFVVALAGASPATAADLVVDISDDNGAAVANAVVTLKPADGSRAPVPAMVQDPATIDQRNEQFVPLVTILAAGGSIVFKNSDRTRHHVYSFSSIKPFEFVLNPGKQSPPVVMDQPGVAAIGCNIHDRMVAYVFVSDTAWSALSNASGQATLVEIPDGAYKLSVWHPQLKAGDQGPQQDVIVSGASQSAKATLSLSSERPHGGHTREY